MWELTPTLYCICFGGMLVLFAPIGFAWVALYRLWKSQFHRKAISSDYQITELLTWLLVVAITIFGSIVLLYFYWLVAPIFLR